MESVGSSADVVIGSSTQLTAERVSANATRPRRESSGSIVSAPVQMRGTRRFAGPRAGTSDGCSCATIDVDQRDLLGGKTHQKAKQVPVSWRRKPELPRLAGSGC